MTRVSYATWMIEGPSGRVLVRRLAHQNWLVGHANRPLMPKFFTRKFRTKWEAIMLAKDMAGLYRRTAQPNQKSASECQPTT